MAPESMSMQITCNGETLELPSEATVLDLLRRLELEGRRVAILINDEVVRKAAHAETVLTEGSKVEIIQMVGGG